MKPYKTTLWLSVTALAVSLIALAVQIVRIAQWASAK